MAIFHVSSLFLLMHIHAKLHAIVVIIFAEILLFVAVSVQLVSSEGQVVYWSH